MIVHESNVSYLATKCKLLHWCIFLVTPVCLANDVLVWCEEIYALCISKYQDLLLYPLLVWQHVTCVMSTAGRCEGKALQGRARWTEPTCIRKLRKGCNVGSGVAGWTACQIPTECVNGKVWAMPKGFDLVSSLCISYLQECSCIGMFSTLNTTPHDTDTYVAECVEWCAWILPLVVFVVRVCVLCV